MTNAIWIDEKTDAVRVASDARRAASFGNAGQVFTTSEQLKTSMIPTRVLVDIYNKYAGDKPVKKFTDRQTAADRVWKAITSNELVEDLPDEPEAKAAAIPATPSARANQKARGARGNRAKHVFPIEGKVPFTSGQSAATWKMIMAQPGLKFSDYVEMGARVNTINFAIRNGWLRTED